MINGANGGARPNLSGLFSGTATANRTERQPGVLRPILIKSGPIDDESPAAPGPAPARVGREPIDRSWFDPVFLVGGYFQVAQAMLDAQRRITLEWAAMLSGLPQRVLPRR